MSVFIDSDSRLQSEQASGFALTCPHCGVLSHVTVAAVPHYAELLTSRPKQIGVVYRCDACNAPIFLRFPVRGYFPGRVELSPQFIQVERPREKFNFTYLPEEVEVLFREALACYSHGAFNAFATMCRRTMQNVFANLGESGKLRIFDQLGELREMAAIDNASFTPIKRVIFGSDTDSFAGWPMLDDDQAGLLLEVMKDLLYQSYVRKGRLLRAMVVRRFFSDQSERGTTKADSATPSPTGA